MMREHSNIISVLGDVSRFHGIACGITWRIFHVCLFKGFTLFVVGFHTSFMLDNKKVHSSYG